MRTLDDITGEIIDAAIQIHIALGPGLLESTYQTVITAESRRRGLIVERHKPIPFEFNGMHFEANLRVDLLVESQVIVELKSVEKLAPVHSVQLLTYLGLMNLQVGLLINFGAATLKEGLRRIVNGYQSSGLSAAPRLRVKNMTQ